MSGQTFYISEWENKNKYPETSLWISSKADEKTFCCRICHEKPLQLGNMEIKALRTLGKRSSHITKIEANKNQSTLSKSLEASASKK